MNYKAFQNINLSRLGMGNMRLPTVNPNDPNSQIDYEKSFKLIDCALENGINYFDTAYVYNDGDSEKCLGQALKRHPRDQYYIATKYYLGAGGDVKDAFEEQLKRLQTDYIDFYLTHCLLDNNIDKYLDSGCIDFLFEQKKKGKISYVGFSSHASVETLEKYATKYPWDFAQLQINYFDWNYDETKKEYEVLSKLNIPIMVMEPVRGGRLASLTPEAEALLKDIHPTWSIASWAMRFVETLPNVQVVLSGMSNTDQLLDNVATFSDAKSLNDDELAILNKACELFKSKLCVPCTDCKYCTSGCPVGINIPAYLSVYNKYKTDGQDGILKRLKAVESEGKYIDCIQCGQCTNHCPQGIDTPNIMKELTGKFKF